VAEVRKSIQVAQYERTVQTALREVADGLASRAYLEQAVQAETRRRQLPRGAQEVPWAGERQPGGLTS
jgi:multidrug efflux system outer membrane protein